MHGWVGIKSQSFGSGMPWADGLEFLINHHYFADFTKMARRKAREQRMYTSESSSGRTVCPSHPVGSGEGHPPPLVEGRRLRIRYMTQIKTRPPTFALFVSRPADLPESYLRYLTSGLRVDFGLRGVPIRMIMRKRENPFAPN